MPVQMPICMIVYTSCVAQLQPHLPLLHELSDHGFGCVNRGVHLPASICPRPVQVVPCQVAAVVADDHTWKERERCVVCVTLLYHVSTTSSTTHTHEHCSMLNDQLQGRAFTLEQSTQSTLTVWVQHGHHLEHKVLAQLLCFLRVACEVLNQTTHHPAGIGLSRVYASCESKWNKGHVMWVCPVINDCPKSHKTHIVA